MMKDDMDGDISKLITLLKKILKNHPNGADIAKWMNEQNSINLNMCFLTIVPMASDDLDELEDIYEDYLKNSDELFPVQEKKHPRLEFKLNPDDMHFLKKNGIKF